LYARMREAGLSVELLETRHVRDAFTHQSEIKTTFLLYFAAPTGMKVACDATGAVSIIGRWKPFV
jgi:hypothetical protein